jgi:hypothetical protein
MVGNSQRLRIPVDRIIILNSTASFGKDWIAAYYAAQPELASFSPPADNHREAANVLSACQYDRWIAIEMREQANDPILAIEQAVTEVQRIYSINPSTERGAH